jgi:hypothetical protein
LDGIGSSLEEPRSGCTTTVVHVKTVAEPFFRKPRLIFPMT